MENFKLPITKVTLDIICEALELYKSFGISKTSSEQVLKMYSGWRKIFEDAGDDVVKQTQALVSMSLEEIKAQKESYSKISMDVDITLGRIQTLKKRLNGKNDEYLIDDLLKEIV